MRFELMPVLDMMINFYQQPRDFNRFKAYIQLMTGSTDNDVEIPIGAYNPMAKPHVMEQLLALKDMQAEKIVDDMLQDMNMQLKNEGGEDTFKVALTLADDLMGGWTNRYTTDYASRYKSHAMIKRHFCLPYLFSSEAHSPALIRQRTAYYCYSTLYWITHTKAVTLADHIAHEVFIAQKTGIYTQLSKADFDAYKAIFEQYQASEDQPIIFSFLYGDKAAEQLGYTPLGMANEMAGYKFAGMLAAHQSAL